MVTMKIIGSLFIMISSTLIGLEYSKKYTERLNNLNYIQNCIQILETEIVYACNPLPNALENVYKKGNKNVSFLFEEVRKSILGKVSKNIHDSFYDALKAHGENLYLINEDIEIILALGRVLGTSNRMDQQKHFKTALTNLDMKQKEAYNEKVRNAKMYKQLGILFGLAVVIILY